MRFFLLSLLAVALAACSSGGTTRRAGDAASDREAGGGSSPRDGGGGRSRRDVDAADAGLTSDLDAGAHERDAPPHDAPPHDAPPHDAPPAPHDAGLRDALPYGDTGSDAPSRVADAATCAPLDGGSDARWEVSAPPSGDRLLFIGDSFTSTNDLPGTFRSMVAAWSSSAPPFVASSTVGGATLTDDVGFLGDGGDGGLGALLGAADAALVSWTNVMLQEQSEIPGFGLTNPERVSSMTSVVTLSNVSVRDHAKTVLVMTWGYRSGDAYNESLYPDFLTMEYLLEIGYRQMAQAVAEAGDPVLVAPVGPAFEAIYFADQAAGRIPTDPSSLFYSLYHSDGKHPSPRATYLMALVLMSTVFGVDPAAVCENPESLDPGDLAVFRAAARTAVVEERQYQPYLTYDAGCGPCVACATSCCDTGPCPP